MDQVPICSPASFRSYRPIQGRSGRKPFHNRLSNGIIACARFVIQVVCMELQGICLTLLLVNETDVKLETRFDGWINACVEPQIRDPLICCRRSCEVIDQPIALLREYQPESSTTLWIRNRSSDLEVRFRLCTRTRRCTESRPKDATNGHAPMRRKHRCQSILAEPGLEGKLGRSFCEVSA